MLKLLPFLFLTTNLFCQLANINDLPVGNWHIEHYTTNEGLKQMQVSDIFVASDNKVWIATRGGVCTFDGNEFDRFDEILSKPDYAIGIKELSDGTIVIDGGRYLYTFNGEKFKKIRTPDSYNPIFYSRISVDWKDAIWLHGKPNNTIIFHQDSFFTPNSYLQDSIFDISEEFAFDNSNKTIYNINKRYYLEKYIDGQIDSIKISKKQNTWNQLRNKQSKEFFADNISGILEMTTKSGLGNNHYLDFERKHIITCPHRKHEIDTSIMSTISMAWFLDNESNLIVNHKGEIIMLLQDVKKHYNQFLCLARNNGIFYVGTDKGLLVIKESAFKIYPEKNYPFVWSVFEDLNGEVYTSSWGQGIKKINHSRIPILNNPSIEYQRKSKLIYFHPTKSEKGKVIIPYLGGLFEMKQGKLKHKYPIKNEHEKNHEILYTEIDTSRDFQIIAGTCPGVEILDKNYNLIEKIDNNLFKNRCIESISIDHKKNYWFGDDNGIAQYNPDSKELNNYNLNETSNRQAGAICSYVDQQGTLWIGGKRGLSYYEEKSDQFIFLDTLKEYYVRSITQATTEKYFLGTSHGLLMIDLNQAKKTGRIISKLFSQKEGFTGIQCGQSGFYTDSQNTIWITSSTDLINFNPDELNYNNDLKLNIEVYKINGHRYTFDERPYKIEKNTKEITIDFKKHFYPTSKEIFYSYRWNNEDWSNWNSSTQARLTGLSSGKYKFAVKAKLEASDIESPIAQSLFVVNNSLSNEPYFNKVLLLLVISSLGGLLLLIKNRRLHKELNKKLINKNEVLTKEKIELVFQKEELQQINKQLEKKVIHNLGNEDKILLLSGLGKSYKLKHSDIIYIKAEADGVRIYSKSNTIWSDQTLKTLIEQLDYPFIQIFRSTLININHVKWVNSNELQMENGTVLKIGRTYKKDLVDFLK